MPRTRSGKAALTELDLLREISHKLDVLAGMIAAQGKEPAVQIRILTRVGVPSSEIGALLNMRADSVRHSRTR